MRVFLDFEASSLGDDSYPIEVGWVFEDGREESHLIRPAPDWTDWDDGAQAIHGIARTKLVAEGEPHDAVARRVLDELGPHTVYVSAPSWDGKWLSTLFRAAGLPRHSLRLRDTESAREEAARAALAPVVPADQLAAAAENVIVLAELRRAEAPVAHRALADATMERDHWLLIRDAALAEARRIAAHEAG